MKRSWLAVPLCMLAGGCGNGFGDATFTVWGEDYATVEIPAKTDMVDGFEDGWRVRFSKVLVTLSDISVSSQLGGMQSVGLAQSTVFDLHTTLIPRAIGTLRMLPAQRWDQIGFQILPATAMSVAGNATESDLQRMKTNGYSVYLEGQADRADRGTYSFAWGFANRTAYTHCTNDDNSLGLVVQTNSTTTAQITVHTDHVFYDHLTSPNAVLRFDAIANADRNADRTVTLDELATVALVDLPRDQYGGSGAVPNTVTLRDFITALVSTMGHWNGEGHCAERRL